MYFVNRSEIEQTVTHIDKLITIAQETKSFANDIEKLGLERVVHVVIESILDVGNMMIDGFIMRDPGSYHDIIDILVDEKVIPAEEEAAYKAVIDLRQMLVQDYLAIDHAHVEKTFFEQLPVLKMFSTHIRQYLVNELGVANAFSNES
ncbi:DUF86 domain-containing protein [Pseudogracilibacillus sp. ICA-222130]|uniref:DUF86 domain-containing protein n=1 Tax=Pseudogracilibacillus sp. ICA-222130 TaxID=3134655 RepID=UPI0030BDB330